MNNQNKTTAPQPVPRGVASADGKSAYLAGPGDTVQAVELDSGARSWSVSIGGQPILAADGKVFVVREVSPSVLELRILDEFDGHEIGQCNVPFPPGIDVSALPGQFDLRPSLVDGKLVVDWEARSSYKGGAPPPSYVEKGFTQTTSGAFRCDLSAGQIQTAPSAADSPKLHTSWPYRLGGAWQELAWRLGDLQAALLLDRLGDEPVIRLQTFVGAGEKPLRSTEIATSEAVEPTVTPDGQFLFLRQTVPADGRWHIWKVADHEPMGSITHEPGSDFPTLLGERVFYTVPLSQAAGTAYQLRAVDFSNDEILWELDLGGAAPEKLVPPPPRMR